MLTAELVSQEIAWSAEVIGRFCRKTRTIRRAGV
jgi:hypothetical protein